MFPVLIFDTVSKPAATPQRMEALLCKSAFVENPTHNAILVVKMLYITSRISQLAVIVWIFIFRKLNVLHLVREQCEAFADKPSKPSRDDIQS